MARSARPWTDYRPLFGGHVSQKCTSKKARRTLSRRHFFVPTRVNSHFFPRESATLCRRLKIAEFWSLDQEPGESIRRIRDTRRERRHFAVQSLHSIAGITCIFYAETSISNALPVHASIHTRACMYVRPAIGILAPAWCTSRYFLSQHSHNFSDVLS